MINYTLGFVFHRQKMRKDRTNQLDSVMFQVLLLYRTKVTDDKQAWQVGLYNGIGGKLEGNETDFQCISRECEEETGMYIAEPHWRKIGILRKANQEYVVRLFMTEVTDSDKQKCKKRCDDGYLHWIDVQGYNVNVHCIGGLYSIIPFCINMLTRNDNAKTITLEY